MTLEPDTGDDRDLDAFLRGEDALSALLADVPQPAPSPELDARIHAQARAALDARAPAVAANEAVAPHAPRTGWLWRARTPLALAATVVLGVSLGLRWEGWRDQAPGTVYDAGPAAAAPAAKPQVTPAPQPDAAPAPPPPPPPAPARHAPKIRHVRPSAPAPVPAPAPAAAPAPPPPALAAAPAQFSRAAPADIVIAEDAGALAPLTIVGQRAARSAPPHLARAPAPARTYTPAEDERARQWLDLVNTLLDRGLDTDARRAWPEFRAEFPDYPVPPGLQARIDALQAH